MQTFSKAVLETVQNIPSGSVMSYAEVAKSAGFPGAYRAVGTIMAKNSNPAVPCHRVVKSNGVLGNYNKGGTNHKMRLLESEGVEIIKKSHHCIIKKL